MQSAQIPVRHVDDGNTLESTARLGVDAGPRAFVPCVVAILPLRRVQGPRENKHEDGN